MHLCSDVHELKYKIGQSTRETAVSPHYCVVIYVVIFEEALSEKIRFQSR